MLTKEQIRDKKDRPREWVPTEEWTPDGEQFDPKVHGVWVGTMSANQRDFYDLELRRRKEEDGTVNLVGLRGLIGTLTIQNEDGSRMFENEDQEWLGTKSTGPLSSVFDVAVRLNKLRSEDEAQDIKNSKTPTSDSSSS